jgi:NADPH:quinone reductase-like Zn-dependent oxidoreductase/CubicO group peptidase (beta-lactamase class C family)
LRRLAPSTSGPSAPACAFGLASLVPRVLALATCSAAALALAPTTPAAAQAQDRLAPGIDSIARAAVEQGEVVGLSVAVVLGGEPIRIRGYGAANLESATLATDSTLYYVGSITKSVTAAMIHQLAERGRLDLDDDVTRHIPELDSPGPTITLRHLLLHTSGLPGPQEVAHKFLDRRHLDFSRDDLLSLVQGEPRVSDPGDRLAYNNLGYMLLGLVAERVSGLSYQEYLATQLLGGTGDRSLALCDARPVIRHRASGYLVRDGRPFNHEPVNASLLFAAGGLCANAADIAWWLRSLARGEILSPERFREMSTPGRLADGSTLTYGHGLFVEPLGGHRRIHHGGVANGFASHAAYYPDLDLAVVVLTNTRSAAAPRIEEQIARLFLGGETPATGAEPSGRTMLAVRISEFGGPDVLRYEEAPRPAPGPGELLVQVHAAAVNPVDTGVRAGHAQGIAHARLPYIPGYDLSGVVVEVGEGVTRFSPGDEVFAMLHLRRGGAYAEYAIVKDAEAAAKPATVSHAEAASLPLVALTAWQALFDTADLQAGETVLIHAGAGGVGSIAAQLAKWRGATVIATASEANHEFLRSLGVDVVIDYRTQRFEDVARDVDVVLDPIGGDTQVRSLGTLRDGGRMVGLVGLTPTARSPDRGIRATAILVDPDSAQLRRIAELVDAGHVRPIVSHLLPLDQAPDAHRQSETGRTRGKIVLEVRP